MTPKTDGVMKLPHETVIERSRNSGERCPYTERDGLQQSNVVAKRVGSFGVFTNGIECYTKPVELTSIRRAK